MENGLFILLYNEEDLKLYLKNKVYGFLMNPLDADRPTSRSKYFSVLADYGCARPGTKVFFFLKRKIYYGGTITNNGGISFYLNGLTSPLGRSNNAELFWDESSRYFHTEDMPSGRFRLDENDPKIKAQPFMIKFETNENTGKFISTDDLYFEIGQNAFPLPSNSIMGMSFCVLTPGETTECLNLIGRSTKSINYMNVTDNCLIEANQIQCPFNTVNYNDLISESELEFSIVSDLRKISHCVDLENTNYCVCRQVPISPFKPMNMDRADICLYDSNNPLLNGLIPNVVIELKKDTATKDAYKQVQRYLGWLKVVVRNDDIFDNINAVIIARDFNIKRNKVVNADGSVDFENKIKMYNILNDNFYTLQ